MQFNSSHADLSMPLVRMKNKVSSPYEKYIFLNENLTSVNNEIIKFHGTLDLSANLIEPLLKKLTGVTNYNNLVKKNPSAVYHGEVGPVDIPPQTMTALKKINNMGYLFHEIGIDINNRESGTDKLKIPKGNIEIKYKKVGADNKLLVLNIHVYFKQNLQQSLDTVWNLLLYPLSSAFKPSLNLKNMEELCVENFNPVIYQLCGPESSAVFAAARCALKNKNQAVAANGFFASDTSAQAQNQNATHAIPTAIMVA